MIRGPRASTEEYQGWGLRMYSSSQLDAIHDATLEVLRLTGVEVHLEEAVDVLEEGGCIVDRATKIVKFPAYVVEEALASCPSSILLAARDPRYDYWMGGKHVGYTNFGCGIMVTDPETGEVNETTKEDMGRTALACDAMENVDVYSTAVVARDMPDASYDLHMLEAAFLNTSKHVHHIDVSSGANARKMFEMAALIAGGDRELRERPLVSTLVCPTSPLMLHTVTCEVIMESARWGCPINVLSMAMSGASSPVSVSGTLVTHNAEVLAGLTLAQLTSKGAPAMYGSSTTMFDMTYATAPVGAPELGMISAAVAELSNYYNLPSYVAGG
ncbi:MAG: trimethylamine methyltransferase family protein [Actinobacteria bacterium]|nr:trimethylamine methyltransferase family protein [Actinomycetota bacterium]